MDGKGKTSNRNILDLIISGWRGMMNTLTPFISSEELSGGKTLKDDGELIKWFTALPLEERLIVSSISEPWFVSVIEGIVKSAAGEFGIFIAFRSQQRSSDKAKLPSSDINLTFIFRSFKELSSDYVSPDQAFIDLSNDFLAKILVRDSSIKGERSVISLSEDYLADNSHSLIAWLQQIITPPSGHGTLLAGSVSKPRDEEKNSLNESRPLGSVYTGTLSGLIASLFYINIRNSFTNRNQNAEVKLNEILSYSERAYSVKNYYNNLSPADAQSIFLQSPLKVIQSQVDNAVCKYCNTSVVKCGKLKAPTCIYCNCLKHNTAYQYLQTFDFPDALFTCEILHWNSINELVTRCCSQLIRDAYAEYNVKLLLRGEDQRTAAANGTSVAVGAKKKRRKKRKKKSNPASQSVAPENQDEIDAREEHTTATDALEQQAASDKKFMLVLIESVVHEWTVKAIASTIQLQKEMESKIKRVSTRSSLRTLSTYSSSSTLSTESLKEAPDELEKEPNPLQVSNGNTGNANAPPHLLTTPHVDHTVFLHNDITEMANLLEMIAERRKHWQLSIAEKIKAHIYQIYPKCFVEVFGSVASGLASPGSDIDLVVCGISAQTHISYLAAFFSSQKDWVTSLECVLHTAIPVIKLKTACIPISYGNQGCLISVDITFENSSHHGLNTCNFLKDLTKAHPMLKPLVLVLKQFLIEKGLNDPFVGGLSSYGLVLMITSVIQRRFMLELGAVTTSQFPTESINLGTLFIDFLTTYSNLDFVENGVSIGTGYNGHNHGMVSTASQHGPHYSASFTQQSLSQVEPRIQQQHSSRSDFDTMYFERKPLNLLPQIKCRPANTVGMPLYIEDPLDKSNNVGRTCFGIHQVINAFAEALDAINLSTIKCTSASDEELGPVGWSILGRVFSTGHHVAVAEFVTKVWCPMENKQIPSIIHQNVSSMQQRSRKDSIVLKRQVEELRKEKQRQFSHSIEDWSESSFSLLTGLVNYSAGPSGLSFCPVCLASDGVHTDDCKLVHLVDTFPVYNLNQK